MASTLFSMRSLASFGRECGAVTSACTVSTRAEASTRPPSSTPSIRQKQNNLIAFNGTAPFTALEAAAYGEVDTAALIAAAVV